MVTKLGLRGGWSLDLSQPCTHTGKTWNCVKEEDRQWAKRRLYADKPELLVVCPPCTLSSSLQHLSPNGLPEKRDAQTDGKKPYLCFGFQLSCALFSIGPVELLYSNIRVRHHPGRMRASEIVCPRREYRPRYWTCVVMA